MEEQTLRGERTLLPDEVAFVYGVHRQEELLQFTMANYYDLNRGEVSDTPDVEVFEYDKRKETFTY